MIKSIAKVFLKKWYLFLLLIPSALVAYIISLIVGFYIANLYKSDYLGIFIMKLIFSILTPIPIPILIFRKSLVENNGRKINCTLVCVLLYLMLVNTCYILMNHV